MVHYADDVRPSIQPDAFALATDGEIHHYAFTLTGGTVGTLYLDGAVVSHGHLPGPYVFDDDFSGRLSSVPTR